MKSPKHSAATPPCARPSASTGRPERGQLRNASRGIRNLLLTALILMLALSAGASGTASRAADTERQGAPSLAPFGPAAAGRAAAMRLHAVGFAGTAQLSKRLAAPPAADGLTTGLTTSASGLFSFYPVLLQETAPAAETVTTYGGDCTTPKTTFQLGDTVCAKVTGEPADGARVLRRLVFAHPDGFALYTADVSAATESYLFTLPSDEETGFGGLQIDNRGTWLVATVDTDEAGLRAITPITVRDPQGDVSDLQITKTPVIGRPVAGQNFSYIIHVFNLGPDAAQNVRFTDTPPANTAFVSLVQNGGPSFTCTTTAGLTTCTGASLGKEQSAFFTATYLVNPNIPNGAEISDTLTVTSDTTERSVDDNDTGTSDSAGNPTPPACTVGCPGNITVTAEQGAGGAVVTFDDPTATGTCGGAPQVMPASGSFFGIGSSSVTATTPGGQSCSFVVTVNAPTDNNPPSISCPADISVPESSGSANSATVNYNVMATDDSGSVEVDCDHPSGSSFPVGETPVICTATDAAGNTASCTFEVTVTNTGCDLGTTAPTPNVAQLPDISRSCSASIVASEFPRATDSCGATITGSTSDDLTYDTPGTYVVHWTYTDSAGNTATQNQTVIIAADNVAPVPNASQLPTVTGECTATVSGPAPTATDNCAGDLEGTTTDPLTYNTPGTHTVNWKFTDNAGNTTTQTQTVIVTDNAAPVPSVPSLPAITAECSVTLTPPTANDNCAGTVTATTNIPLTITQQGTHTVNWTYTDAAGNTATQTQTVVIDDNTQPTITAPPAKTVYTGPGATSCGAVVSDADLGSPTAGDNCAGFVTGRSGVPAGNAFPVGTTVVTYTVTDVGGNTATATQAVTVVDNTPPALAVPNVTVNLPLNSPATSMAVSYPAPTTGDNCGGPVSVVYTPASGSVFGVGTTVVSATATDTHGNTTTATFNVTVLFNFTGFFSPVENLPTLNQVSGGRAIPVKFSLSGNKGLGIFPANTPTSIQIGCASGVPVSDVEETLTAGSSSLAYDASSDRYHYVWKTQSAWAGTCRQLIITLTDGTTHTANFKFK